MAKKWSGHRRCSDSHRGLCTGSRQRASTTGKGAGILSELKLELRNFTAGYTGSPSIVLGVDMDLRTGSVTAVIGPNGSGKSTLLKGIMGFPGVHASGTLQLGSADLTGMDRRAKARLVGYLPQSPPVPAGLTGLQTVLLGRHPFRSSWAGDSREDLEAAHRALHLVGAEHLSDKRVDRISGGEFRLVNLAAVLVQDTPLILLDEPGSSLDYGHAAHLWEVLSQLASTGRIIIATTHRIGMAAGHFHSILLLSGGTPVQFGTPEEVFSDSGRLSDIYRTPLKMMQNSAGKGWIVCPAEKE